MIGNHLAYAMGRLIHVHMVVLEYFPYDFVFLLLFLVGKSGVRDIAVVGILTNQLLFEMGLPFQSIS